jgi:uncharacterized protein YtpQ (UPF0354 family)
MWLWVLCGWCAVAVSIAALHRRLRRGADRYPPEIAAFVLRLENELDAVHPEVAFLGLLPERFACLLRVDGQETVVGLNELYRHAEAQPDGFTRLVARLLTDIREIGLDRVDDLDFASVATALMPQVRSAAWLDTHGRFGDSGLAHTPLNDDLVTVYVVDVAQSMVFVCRDHLRRWRRSVEDVHQLALANLERRGTDGLPKVVEPQPVVLQSGDGFDAARVLLLQPAEGLLVAIPDRDTLWVGPEQGQNLEQLMAVTEAIAAQAPHPVSGQVFRVTDGRLAAVAAPR